MKHGKRMLALLLSLSMVLPMAAPATFAAPEEPVLLEEELMVSGEDSPSPEEVSEPLEEADGLSEEETGALEEADGLSEEETGSLEEETGTSEEETGTPEEEADASEEETGTPEEEVETPKSETVVSGGFVDEEEMVALEAAAEAPYGVEFQMILERWREYLVGKDLDLSVPQIKSYVDSLNASAQDYWSSMNQSADAGRTILWNDLEMNTVKKYPYKDSGVEAKLESATVTQTYERLYTIARAYVTSGCGDFYQKGEVLTELLSAYQFLHDGDFYNASMCNSKLYGNWYQWEIGIPQKLLNALVILWVSGDHFSRRADRSPRLKDRPYGDGPVSQAARGAGQDCGLNHPLPGAGGGDTADRDASGRGDRRG